jgi:hypothetical protein
MAFLKDDRGTPLGVYAHNELWITAMQRERLLCLLAPRDHGKSYTSMTYIAWRLWRHNRGPDGVLYDDRHEGVFETVLFSSNKEIATALFLRLQQFLLDNPDLFGDILPVAKGVGRSDPNWSKSLIRLKNGATVVPKAIGSATRGLHPDLVVVDDILSDKNSLTALQRGRVWAYLIGTIGPMPGPDGQLVVIGTAQHYDDALHRLRRDKRYKWLKFRAVDWATGRTLWPERYNLDALDGIRAADPVIFSKEYQNDPRDDAASLFPYASTAGAVERGATYTFVGDYPITARTVGEYVVASADLAISEAVGADYTVLMVSLYSRYTQERRLLWGARTRGLTFDEQVQQIRDVCRRYNVDTMVVEANTFQKWLHQHLAKFPETSGRVFGHTTGIEKQSMVEGVPSLKIILQNELWTWPVGDEESAEFTRELRSELNAFGYVDGKLQGSASHDDMVMSWWLTERAIRQIEALPEMPSAATVYAEDMGIERVRIGSDL